MQLKKLLIKTWNFINDTIFRLLVILSFVGVTLSLIYTLKFLGEGKLICSLISAILTFILIKINKEVQGG